MGLLRMPNERHVVVNGWEVAAVAPSVSKQAVCVQVSSATFEVRQRLSSEHARELAALLVQAADEVDAGKEEVPCG